MSYKTGVGEDDFQFLKYVSEIINNNVEVVLAVNMCPQNIDMDNKRINEIRNSVCECIHKDIETFLLKAVLKRILTQISSGTIYTKKLMIQIKKESFQKL